MIRDVGNCRRDIGGACNAVVDLGTLCADTAGRGEAGRHRHDRKRGIARRARRTHATTALYRYLPCAEAVSDPSDAVIDVRHLSDGHSTRVDGDPGDIARVGSWVREASDFHLDVASKFVREIDGFRARTLEVGNRLDAMASALGCALDGLTDIHDDERHAEWVTAVASLASSSPNGAWTATFTTTGIFTSGGVDHVYETGDASRDGFVDAGLEEIGAALHATTDSSEDAVGGITSLRQGFDRAFG